MSDDTQSETAEGEVNEKQKKMNEEKINSLREVLGPLEARGSSMGLAWDLQTERTRFVEDKKSRPPEFSECEWLALSRTTRYPDNSTLAGSRIPKAFYDYYRLHQTLCGFWQEYVNKSAILKVNIQTLKVELYKCNIDHSDHSSISRLLFTKDEEYNSSKRDVQDMQITKRDGIRWAYNNFLNIKKVQMVLPNNVVQEFLQNPSKLNLMKIVRMSLYVYDKNQKKVHDFYQLDNFKRKYHLHFTSESREDSEDSEENLERTIKKPKRNDDKFLEHLKELNFMCSGVPGRACRLKGEQLDKDDFDYDHIWPWKFSKDDSRKNKRPLCVSCHRWKTNNIDKHLKDDHEAVQMLQHDNVLPDRLMKLVHPNTA